MNAQDGSRRRCLQALVAAGLGGSGLLRTLPTLAQATPPSGFERALPLPPLLHGAPQGDGTLAYALHAGGGTSELVAGLRTPTWGYNGAVLGPTLVIPRGRAVDIAIRNGLPQGTTVHWHGAHVPGEMDGGPHDEIAPGTTWHARFTLEQPGATLWYHPHPMNRTGAQVYAGLAGLLLVDDGVDRELGLPHTWGVDDIPLILQDRRLAADGTLVYMSSPTDLMGMQGNRLLVNGCEQPHLEVPAQWLRLRLLNGSNRRIYSLGFSDERIFYAVASDAGLLAQPVPLQRLRLYPAERAEILVDLRSDQGRALVLQSWAEPEDDMMPMLGSMAARGPARSELLQLRVVAATGTGGRLPDALATLPEVADAPPQRSFNFDMMLDPFDHMAAPGTEPDRSGPGGMSMGVGGRPAFSINGEFMDMAVINLHVPLGATETWEVRNTVLMPHSFHVHGTSFRILSRNGMLPPEHERGWKDVVALAPGETARMQMRFDQPASAEHPYMYHCHMLEHEDNGMMGQFTVG